MPQFGQCPLGGSLHICITARFFGKSAAHILPLQAVVRLATARRFVVTRMQLAKRSRFRLDERGDNQFFLCCERRLRAGGCGTCDLN